MSEAGNVLYHRRGPVLALDRTYSHRISSASLDFCHHSAIFLPARLLLLEKQHPLDSARALRHVAAASHVIKGAALHSDRASSP